jgi:hypothetical protein
VIKMAGHTIAFDESAQGKSLTLTDSAGNEIVLDSTKRAVSVTSKGDLTISAKGKISIKSTSGDLTLEAGGKKIAMTSTGVDVT